ncbi:hypothetical protein DTG75_08455 [Salmonella enterica subsp. salamae]|uniref:Uncharacterized protein n=1 Tax=Salmonella enterica subsp. salamae serovar 55:k:z39 str. 1315K TaxID=1243602 RepID=A0A6C7CBC1_SALER|nr:hypothetical protein LFZ47_03305 [Salmonella enterica subsp. salamae serovar 55:k:z39 str. 1315K]ECC1480252.1 hypothetical protein [Salmonella enterica subsp. salamae]EEL7718114.1 hypothetical protein [Salmonella enterica]ECC1657906.1 hypothetical protein [Salmonella enterica subsp. salamae]ECC1694702.1 hypothetical protein [Salmonella enterica subsp. salamae]
MLVLVNPVLAWIECNFHIIIVCTINGKAIGKCLLASAQLSGVSVFLRRCRRFISPFTAVTINCALVSPVLRLFSNSATTSCGKRALICCDLLLIEPVAIAAHPLGSIPRDCSSLRKARFIQVAKEALPSCFAISSSCARKSSGKRIWYCGSSFLSVLTWSLPLFTW